MVSGLGQLLEQAGTYDAARAAAAEAGVALRPESKVDASMVRVTVRTLRALAPVLPADAPGAAEERASIEAYRQALHALLVAVVAA